MKYSWKGIILIKIVIYWTPTMTFNILMCSHYITMVSAAEKCWCVQ